MAKHGNCAAAALGLVGLLAGAGCGNQTLVAGLFVNTPAVTVPIIAGAPATYGPYTALLGYVSSIDTSQITNLSSASIQGITGAQAQVVYESCNGVTDPTAKAACISSGHGGADRVLTVPDSGGGLYELLSTDDASLTFEPGVTYTLILQVPDGSTSDAYGARFQPGPPAHMMEFADKTKPITLTAGATLSVHRDDAKVNGQYLPAALLVGKIDPMNPNSAPTIVWKSLDYTDPKALALLVLSDLPYRVDHFDIDASAFASSGYYVVTMVSLSEGKASANAFIGSTVLAGTGDAGLVIVQ